MTKFIYDDDDDDFITCENCDANFQLVWTRSLLIDGIEYCPFCGDDVE